VGGRDEAREEPRQPLDYRHLDAQGSGGGGREVFPETGSSGANGTRIAFVSGIGVTLGY